MKYMIILGKKMVNVNEILLVEISVQYPEYERLYGCILITFKNGVTTEILKTEKGYPKHSQIPEAKKELEEEMERDLDIVTRIINNKLNKESEVVR